MSDLLSTHIALTESLLADFRAALARFPDARVDGDKIVSPSVTPEEADDVRLETHEFLTGASPRIVLGVRVGRATVWRASACPVSAWMTLRRLLANPEGRAALLSAMKGA